MTKKELEKNFDFKSLEKNIYKSWEENGKFNTDVNSQKEPFCMLMPPPNVTGNLHCGHIMEHSITDTLVRFKRMTGFETLWQSGLDHAGIATQMMVEKKIFAKEGKTKDDLSREEFLDKIWQWKNESGGQILNQLKLIGAGPDWNRTKFTLDEDLSKTVSKVFIDLFNQGLIYKGFRLVNWDCELQTAVSDLEVESIEEMGKMYFFKYPVANEKGLATNEFITIGTTRPETMFGDTAIAVNQNDERYSGLIGKNVLLPFVNRLIPIIHDEHADPEKGTGAVKITPAHDFNDFEVGHRHNLEMITVIDKKGFLNEKATGFFGLKVKEARVKVVEFMTRKGLFIKAEENKMAIPYSERSKVVIEPMLTEQWYCKMDTMAEKALQMVEDKDVEIAPKKDVGVYKHFLNNIQDWCISRQLVWGHRIPVFYYGDADGEYVAAESFEDAVKLAVEKSGKSEEEIVKVLKQDDDVLDTWFSSALWPFSTLGGFEDTAEREKFFPSSLLITGSDLIFFWVSRMIMMTGHFFPNKVPFKKVFLHGLVMDSKGRKMSKSKGNGVDPELLIEKYGADAVRYYMISQTHQGGNILLNEKAVEAARNFMTKIYNAYKFMEMNNPVIDENFEFNKDLHSVNQWIGLKFKNAVEKISVNFNDTRFSGAAEDLYSFIKGDLCDNYLEMSKALLNSGDEALKIETQKVLGFLKVNVLKMLHPFVPFISEYLWAELVDSSKDNMLIEQKYPMIECKDIDQKQNNVDWLIDVIVKVRALRADLNVPASAFVGAMVEAENFNESLVAVFNSMARLKVLDEGKKQYAMKLAVDTGFVYLDIAENVNLAEIKQMLEAEKSKILGVVKSYEARFANESFVKNAPAELIENQKETLQKNKDRLDKIEEILSSL